MKMVVFSMFFQKNIPFVILNNVLLERKFIYLLYIKYLSF